MKLAKTKDELKTMFATGKKPNGADFAELIEGVIGPKGDKGDTGATGAKGDTGAKGATGLGIKAIALTTTDGAVTGGTATLTDNSTIAITVTTA